MLLLRIFTFLDMQDQGMGRNRVGETWQRTSQIRGETWQKANQIRDKFEYDREQRMREKG